MTTAREQKEARIQAFSALRSAIGTVGKMADIFGLSRKSIERYSNKGEAPPVSRRVGMVHAIAPHAEGSVVAQFATALEVPPAQWPSVARRAHQQGHTPLEADVHGAVLDAGETFGLSPTSARGFAYVLLARLIDLEIDPRSAHGALGAIIKRRTATK